MITPEDKKCKIFTLEELQKHMNFSAIAFGTMFFLIGIIVGCIIGYEIGFTEGQLKLAETALEVLKNK